MPPKPAGTGSLGAVAPWRKIFLIENYALK